MITVQIRKQMYKQFSKYMDIDWNTQIKKGSMLDPNIEHWNRAATVKSRTFSVMTVDRLSYLLWDYLLRGCGKIDGKHMVPARDRVKAPLVGAISTCFLSSFINAKLQEPLVRICHQKLLLFCSIGLIEAAFQLHNLTKVSPTIDTTIWVTLWREACALLYAAVHLSTLGISIYLSVRGYWQWVLQFETEPKTQAEFILHHENRQRRCKPVFFR